MDQPKFHEKQNKTKNLERLILGFFLIRLPLGMILAACHCHNVPPRKTFTAVRSSSSNAKMPSSSDKSAATAASTLVSLAAAKLVLLLLVFCFYFGSFQLQLAVTSCLHQNLKKADWLWKIRTD